MNSSLIPWWVRVLILCAPFLFRRCHQGITKGNGNYHWRWDRLCYCMQHCHSGEDWHGGILDMKTGKELIPYA